MQIRVHKPFNQNFKIKAGNLCCEISLGPPQPCTLATIELPEPNILAEVDVDWDWE